MSNIGDTVKNLIFVGILQREFQENLKGNTMPF
jgi:hypothetical protein